MSNLFLLQEARAARPWSCEHIRPTRITRKSKAWWRYVVGPHGPRPIRLSVTISHYLTPQHWCFAPHDLTGSSPETGESPIPYL